MCYVPLISHLYRATQGRAIFASGSPFDDYTLPSGQVCKSNQANNMYIFPGIGLGAVLGKCRLVSDAMILTAAEALASVLSEKDILSGMVYPDLNDIRKVSLHIAVKVIQQAALEEDNYVDPNLAQLSYDDLVAYIEPRMYQPIYPTLIYQPPGVDE